MTDLPERIFAWSFAGSEVAGRWENTQGKPWMVEYIRADLHAAALLRQGTALSLAADRLDALAARLQEAGDGSAAFGGREWAKEARAALRPAPAVDAPRPEEPAP